MIEDHPTLSLAAGWIAQDYWELLHGEFTTLHLKVKDVSLGVFSEKCWQDGLQNEIKTLLAYAQQSSEQLSKKTKLMKMMLFDESDILFVKQPSLVLPVLHFILVFHSSLEI